MHFSRARLRGHRDGQRRSQRAVAEAAGLSTVDYELIELGAQRPDEAQQQALADALGIPFSQLSIPDGPEQYVQEYLRAVLIYGAPMSDESVQRVAEALRRPRVEVAS
jgi:transcriptional regulator with XRE-family HTH domain